MPGYTQTKDFIEVEQVATACHVVRDRSNMGFVTTADGVVVVDTLMRADLAKQVYQHIRSMTDRPIHKLIYTHSHFDHVNAAREYLEPGTQVVAQANVVTAFDLYRAMPRYFQTIHDIQFNGQIGAENTKNLVYPDATFEREDEFNTGGKYFCLSHSVGETDDHCIVHLPEDGIVFVGDQFTGAFPNIGTPQRPNRDERKWAAALRDIQKMEPELLIPGHRPVLHGRKTIAGALQDTIDALEYLGGEVAARLDKGESLEEMAAQICLPRQLEESPWLDQSYGCMAFAVRGIYRNYTGWFDGGPASLQPLGEKTQAALLLGATSPAGMCAGAESICAQAARMLKQNRPHEALYLLNLLAAAGTPAGTLWEFRKKALEQCAAEAPNMILKDMYQYFAQEVPRA